MLRATAIATICLSLLGGSAALSQTSDTSSLRERPTLNYYGLPGLMDMPTAGAMPDGALGFTLGHMGNSTRGTLSFQLLPRLTATFRYTALNGFNPELLPNGNNRDPADGVYYYDRSFDLHFLAVEEAGWWPAVAIGIRDIAGTGVYGSEYVVATRHFGQNDQLAVTAGIGWGRLGERNGFANPLGAIAPEFETRPRLDFGQGGTFSVDQFFRGDAALFAGVEWQATDRLRLQVEYSPDTYIREVEDGLLTIDSPWNFGATYQLGRSSQIGLSYLYGTTVGLSFNILIDPRNPGTSTLTDRAPVPVVPRPAQATPYGTDWVAQPDGPSILSDNVRRLFAEENLDLLALNLDAQRAVIRVRNTHYGFESQALGRVMRVLNATMPNSVEVFEVIFVAQGMDVSRVRMARRDIEALEHDPNGANLALARADVVDSSGVRDPETIEIIEPAARFTWGIAPYIQSALFDPARPFQADFGVEARARYEFGNGFVADGAIRARVAGQLDEQRQVDGPVNSPTAPAPVRTDAYLYNQQGDVPIERLTFSHYGRPAPDFYSRITFGLLERMYAGVSAELLWQPVDSSFGIGLEINHVQQREYDGLFGLRDYNVTMGHASAYFDLGDNFEAQVDVGRYLAGDWGTTIRLERVFNNGWRVGAFATLTDVSFDDFGEGSFDKGVTLEIPISWGIGSSDRRVINTTIRPVFRDGGATLNVNGRLHDIVTDYQRPRFEDTQGMIWR